MHTLTPELKQVILSKLQVTKDDAGNKLHLFGPIKMPIKLHGGVYSFQWYTWLVNNDLPEDTESLLEVLPNLQLANLQQSSFLTYGDFTEADEAKVRLHSICHTGDIFGSQRCDCGSQLHNAFEQIIECGVGGVFYIANHEGRGIGLFNKALTYALQEQGLDTAEANLVLGHGLDNRSYEDVVTVLKMLRQKPVVLLSNNPAKFEFLKNHGIKVSHFERATGEVSDFNRSYLQTKIERFNHVLKLPM